MQSRTQQEQAEGIPLFITPLIASDFYQQMLIGHIDYTRKGSNKGKNHQMLIGNFDYMRTLYATVNITLCRSRSAS